MQYDLLEILLKNAQPIAGYTIQTLASAFISALFLKGNTARTEFEKIKVKKTEEVIDFLMKSEQLSFIDLVKCKNILAIAQKAEQFNTKCDNKKIEEKINFDWFVRFFESAGSISDQDMQDLWARILNEEIQKAGKFSFRTLDVFFKMDKDEILAFQYCAKNKLISPYGEYFLLNSDEALVPDDDNMGYDLAITEESDISSIMAATYNINSNVIRLLEGAELLSTMLTTSDFIINEKPISIYNGIATILLNLKSDCGFTDFRFELTGFRFSYSAIELFSIVNEPEFLSFILDYARLIERQYPFLDVRVYKKIKDGDIDYIYDDTLDILHNDKYANLTKITD